VAGLVEPAPAAHGLAPQLGPGGVLVEVTLEQGDRLGAVVDGAGAVAAGLADRVGFDQRRGRVMLTTPAGRRWW